jgi:hypothetical protein
MKSGYKKSFLGSIVAIVLGTSCCWITSLAVWLGGATVLTVFARFISQYQYIFLVMAGIFFAIGVYQLWKNKKVH